MMSRQMWAPWVIFALCLVVGLTAAFHQSAASDQAGAAARATALAQAAAMYVPSWAYLTTVAVDPRIQWADTAIDFQDGKAYGLLARGRTSVIGGDPLFPGGYGPEGSFDAVAPYADDPAPLPGCPNMALIGKLGRDGAPVFLGRKRILYNNPFEVLNPEGWGAGRFFVMVNDHPGGLWDNIGMFYIDVWVTDKQW